MKDENFNSVRQFLERMLEENPENSELLRTYQQLIDSKFEYDRDEVINKGVDNAK